MTALIRITAPAEEPLTLAEAKAHLRVTISDDDALITALITAARLYCEDFTRRALVTQGWRLWLDSFPAQDAFGDGGGSRPAAPSVIRRFIHLPRPPLLSVEGVTLYDDADSGTVFDPSWYFVDTGSAPGRLALRSNAIWPVPGRAANGIRIDFTAGFGAAADVPRNIRQGLLAHIAQLYENRGDGQLLGRAGAGYVPDLAHVLYKPFRVLTLV